MGHSYQYSKFGASRLGATIVLNLFITAAEFIGGLLSGSLALLSDAGHNFSDVVALVLAWAGTKGAALAPTKKSTYGFKRLEVLTALINALTLVVIAVLVILEAYRRYSNPQPISGLLMLSVAGIGLAGNILSVLILHGERNKTINTRAAFLHMFYDAVSSVVVIIGGILILSFGWYLLDLILSVTIAGMILWSGVDIIREATGIFMEAVPRGIDVDKVDRTIATVPGVEEVHHMHIWSISSRQIALSCHIKIAPKDANRFQEIIYGVHEILKKHHQIDHATIQPECDLCPETSIQETLR